MKHGGAVLLAALLLAGCAGVHEVRWALKPEPNSCQAVEARASAFSTLTTAVCWDQQGHVIGMTGAGGLPAIQAPLEILGAAAAALGPIGGAAILGGKLVEATKNINVKGKGDVTIKPPAKTTVTIEQNVRGRSVGTIDIQ